MLILKPDTLWEAVAGATQSALSAGALERLRTTTSYVEDGGIRFLVRVLSSLRRKAVSGNRSGSANPFLPHDPSMFVADVSDTHLCLLNKFNVVEHHILIITRRFEPQEQLLGPADFEALWACMAQYDALGFYNGGEIAGASQGHKHLQMIPLPMDPSGCAVPVAAVLESAALGHRIGAVQGLPFRHAITGTDPAWLRAPSQSAGAVAERYRALLHAVGIRPDSRGHVPPYNLLAARTWMMLVPRSRECVDGISVNALGFAGSLLARDEGEKALIEAIGPLEILRRVGIPGDDSMTR
jgi:ATP adenylyltransferase